MSRNLILFFCWAKYSVCKMTPQTILILVLSLFLISSEGSHKTSIEKNQLLSGCCLVMAISQLSWGFLFNLCPIKFLFELYSLRYFKRGLPYVSRSMSPFLRQLVSPYDFWHHFMASNNIAWLEKKIKIYFCPALTKLALDLHVNFCLFVCLSVRLSVCVSVCLSGLFFKASHWMIYWLLTVVLVTYLSD